MTWKGTQPILVMAVGGGVSFRSLFLFLHKTDFLSKQQISGKYAIFRDQYMLIVVD